MLVLRVTYKGQGGERQNEKGGKLHFGWIFRCWYGIASRMNSDRGDRAEGKRRKPRAGALIKCQVILLRD